MKGVYGKSIKQLSELWETWKIRLRRQEGTKREIINEKH